MNARILIVDDHEVVRQGLRDILAMAPDLTVVAEGVDGADAERLARERPAELMILDIALPRRNGMAVLESLRAAGVTLPVLLFSMYPAAQYAEYARRAGAQGFVGKDSDAATLLRAIRQILNGEPAFPERLSANGPREDDPFRILSPREFEVMMGLLQGDSLDQIAVRMSVGAKSVSTYRSRLLVKLGLNSNVELAALATRRGYL
jgi:two-component system invasion response regulator UvrY